MEFVGGHSGREAEISTLFRETFTASEGANEGAIVGQLVDDLMRTTAPVDLFAYSALDGQELVGCIFFSRLTYEQDERVVFILSPVAVKTSKQNMGIGRKLIAFGLDALRQENVDVVVTYGDPAYYSKSGFIQLTEVQARAPFELQYPHGWQGQSLSGEALQPLVGAASCVDALNNPELW